MDVADRGVVLVGGAVKTEDNNSRLRSCRVGRHRGRGQVWGTQKGRLRRPEVVIRGLRGLDQGHVSPAIVAHHSTTTASSQDT